LRKQKPNADTIQVRTELERLYGQKGELKPSAVVDAARAKDSPLHKCFEWRDGKAADEYRLIQARKLIRLTVTIIDDKPESYMHVPARGTADDQEGAYHPVSVIVQNFDWYERALSELTSKVHSAMASADELRRAAESVDAPDAERLAKISLAISALQTAGAAIQALH
jgi:hypothetical protein